jgi:putative tricarboxylic transport membrane protein
MKQLRVATTIALVFFLFALGAAYAQKQPYPKDPIRLVITHSAGGTTDMAARLIQPYLQKQLGVPVVIDNMVGAGGNIARAFVFKQPADGYTLLVSQQPSMSAGQVVTGAKFDVLKFTHVFNIAGKNYDCVAVAKDTLVKTMDELKKLSQTKRISLAGTGVGSNSYILAMLLRSKAGINFTYVPFNSGTEAGLALAGGQTDMGTGALDSYWPLHEQGRLRILAVSGPERDESHPDLPTLVELGHSGIKLNQMTGVFAPSGLSKEKLDVLVSAFRRAVADKDYLAAAAKAKQTLQPMGPAEFLAASKEAYDTIQELAPVLKPASK